MIPFHELSERAQKLARDATGRGHRLKLVFNAEERDCWSAAVGRWSMASKRPAEPEEKEKHERRI